MVLTHGIPPDFRGGVRLFKLPYAIGPVPSLLGHAIMWVSPRYYTVDPMLLPSGNAVISHEEFLSIQPMFPPKRLDNKLVLPDWVDARVYRVTQLRTDGVHCRESAGTGAVIVLKLVLVTTGAAFASPRWIDQSMCASLFPHPLLV